MTASDRKISSIEELVGAFALEGEAELHSMVGSSLQFYDEAANDDLEIVSWHDETGRTGLSVTIPSSSIGVDLAFPFRISELEDKLRGLDAYLRRDQCLGELEYELEDLSDESEAREIGRLPQALELLVDYLDLLPQDVNAIFGSWTYRSRGPSSNSSGWPVWILSPQEDIAVALGPDYIDIGKVLSEVADDELEVGHVRDVDLEIPDLAAQLRRAISGISDREAMRSTRSVDVLRLPRIDSDELSGPTLVELLAQDLRVETSRILESIGGGWISCDELISDPYRAGRRWFSVGEPVLAAIGIAKDETSIAECQFIGMGLGGPARLELGHSVEADTLDLLCGRDADAIDFLDEVIVKARRRYRLCRGCRMMRDYLSREDGYPPLCHECLTRYLGVIFD